MKCPLCQNLKTEFFLETSNWHGSRSFSDEKFIILRCLECGLIFPRISPGKDFYNHYYPKNYYQSRKWILGYLERIYCQVVYSWQDLLISSIFTKGKILDFGCGLGQFLSSLPNNYDKYGLEINPLARKFIKKNYPKIKIFSSIDDLNKKSLKFNIIIFNHAIEHLENPLNTVNELTRFLVKGGVVTFYTPNSQSIGLKLSRGRWFHLDAPRHLAIFDKRSLFWMFKKLNLRPIKFRSSLLEYPLDLFWSIFNQIKTSIRFLDFFLIFPVLLFACSMKLYGLINPLYSETLVVIAKKK